MAVASPDAVRGELAGLAQRGLGVREFALAAGRAVGRMVPFDGICLLTLDPATLLPTGEVSEHGLPETAMARMSEIEVAERDFNKFTELARADLHARSLSVATGGDLDRSVRHRELKRPNGFGDELRAALVSGSATWGGLTLLRERGRANFTRTEARRVASVSGELVEGLRRALLLAGAQAPDDLATGLVVLADDDSIELVNAPAEEWLAELGEPGRPDGRLPTAIHAIATRARVAAATARIRTRSGRWLLARGLWLGTGADARRVVILEAARPPELAPLIADAYGLTERERAITQLVAQGLATDEIAGRLNLSPYTVQDHLKAIFEKVDVSSRGGLVARLFFEYYAPRLTSTIPACPNASTSPSRTRPTR